MTNVQGSEDLCVRGWDARQAVKSIPSLHLTGFIYFPTCLSLSRDGNLLAAGCKGFNGVGCDIKVWDLRFLKQAEFLHELRGHHQDVTSCKFFDEDSSIISSSRDGTVRTWTVSSSEEGERGCAQSSSGRGGFTCLDVWKSVGGDDSVATNQNIFYCTGDIYGSITVCSMSCGKYFSQSVTADVLHQSTPANMVDDTDGSC